MNDEEGDCKYPCEATVVIVLTAASSNYESLLVRNNYPCNFTPHEMITYDEQR